MRIPAPIKLIAACLAVGMVMVALGLTPGQVYKYIGDGLVQAWNWLFELLSGDYGRALIWGASIVVPLWIVGMVVMYARRRGKDKGTPF